MELNPTEPPGHARRKLRGLVSEIARLRDEGYTIRVIHRALVDAGVKVGWATVQREVARLKKASPAEPAAKAREAKPAAAPNSATEVTQGKASARPAVDVDAFFDKHTTNPLFKPKRGQK
ncbi:helix-turn-helix domain-containing protein (plasmid) [Paracidovorax citrulli]|uniref:helix-turn-helix domain-containing protein n=1 Tax=Paracidovorax citrulli TaxID=80869 RepID=UPI000B24B9E5|nr:helix-turn-helix domain-containing protein [Paracidovorax citrulli]QCX13168.1 hypothetical protein APS58_p00024 [Paracidovorax citrulli]UMT93548.1 helix-turn-helix domain-containing protein [Paracidovorax citrulli]